VDESEAVEEFQSVFFADEGEISRAATWFIRGQPLGAANPLGVQEISEKFFIFSVFREPQNYSHRNLHCSQCIAAHFSD
jgi:hypothetical protein